MAEYIYDTSRVETQPEQGFTGETIVRCRDCKHTEKGCWCRYFGQFGDLPAVTPDGFCSRGERRQDG